MVAGVIITQFGVGPAFGFNAVSYMTIIAALVSIRLPSLERKDDGARGFFEEIADGVMYCVRHFGIAVLIVISIGISLFARPMQELLPGFADEIFSRGAAGLSILVSANGFGAILGGGWLAQRSRVAGLTRIVLTSTSITGVAVMVFAWTNTFPVAVAASVAAGFTLITVGVASQTLIQSVVDEHMRGRVMSLWGLTFRGAPAVGVLVMGSFADLVGLQMPLMVGGALCLGVGLAILPRLRRLIHNLEGDQDFDSPR